MPSALRHLFTHLRNAFWKLSSYAGTMRGNKWATWRPTKLVEEKHKIQHQPEVRIPNRCWIYRKKIRTNQIGIWLGTANIQILRRTGNKGHSLTVSYCCSFWISTRTGPPSSDTLFKGTATQFWKQPLILCWPQANTKREWQDVNGGSAFMANSETDVFIFRIRWASTRICILPLYCLLLFNDRRKHNSLF